LCHGANSHPGREVTRPAANRPDVIASALSDVADMRPYASLYTADDLADLAAYLGTVFVVPPATPMADAVEYHHRDFDHYFVTADSIEIERLDRGDFTGWSRTGARFAVSVTASTSGALPVCRFFSAAFAPKSSHFYTLLASECAHVATDPHWSLEGRVFHATAPGSAGECPPPQRPLYRLYNDGRGGAPNHRFTPTLPERQTMIAAGWISEGAGPLGVAMCVWPAS